MEKHHEADFAEVAAVSAERRAAGTDPEGLVMASDITHESVLYM